MVMLPFVSTQTSQLSCGYGSFGVVSPITASPVGFEVAMSSILRIFISILVIGFRYETFTRFCDGVELFFLK